MTKRPVADLDRTYDVAIVGATPAGSAAALRARQLGLSTLVIAAESRPRPPEEIDWLGPAARQLCQDCGVNVRAAGASEFAGLQLRSWDLKRSTRVGDADLSGWIVNRAVFDQALLGVAQDAGAQALFGVQPADLKLGEERAALQLRDGREVRARVLLIADGLDSLTAALARVPTARQAEGVATGMHLTFGTGARERGLDVIIGARRCPQAVTIVRAGGRGRLMLVTREMANSAETQFAEFVAAAQAAKLLPDSLVGQPTRSLCPAGVALEMDTLVGKRCLLIGEAAGFVAAFSGETIYPGMISGRVAAEAVALALEAPVLQDALLAFSAAWRAELAEYMRLPNTDLSLLMPLVFNNPQMSGRVARAFLLGQGF